MLALDFAEVERQYLEEAEPALGPDEAFDRRWAATVLEAAFSELEAEKGQGVPALEGHTDFVSSIAFSPASKRIVTASGGWDGQGVGSGDVPGDPYLRRRVRTQSQHIGEI